MSAPPDEGAGDAPGGDSGCLPIPAIPTAIVDATGAGDAVAAVAIYGTFTGLAPRTVARLALAAGAMTVSIEGATHRGLSLEALRAYA